MMKVLIHFLVIIISLGLTSPVLTQVDKKDDISQKTSLKQFDQKEQPKTTSNDQRLFKTAKALMSVNRYDNAIIILEDLVRRNPNNKTYYNSLLQSYLATTKISRADSLVDDKIKLFPNETNYRIDKAVILYRLDRKEEAFGIWGELVEQYSHNLNIYTQIAGVMIQNGLMEEAIQVYKQAIINIPGSTSLYQNIANLYQNRLMNIEATQYYLKYMQYHPKQQNYVFNRILSIQIDQEEQIKFFEMLESMASEAPENNTIQLLLAKLYQRYDKFDKALKIYIQLEDEGGEGKNLLQFARAAEKDSSYYVALQAYRMFIEKYQKRNELFMAYSGIISTLFELAYKTNDLKYANEAMELIDTVRTEFSYHPELPKLIYLQGNFYLNYFFDIDKAILLFSEIVNLKKVQNIYKDLAYLKMGESQIIKGHLTEALTTFNNIKGKKYQGEALLLMAKTYYFQKNWKKSSEVVDKIIRQEGISSKTANDAISLQMILSQIENDSLLLGIFAKAEMLVFQRKKSEAIKKFKELIDNPLAPITIRSSSYLQIAKLFLDLNEPAEAIDHCNQAIKDPSIVNYADQHLFLMASILEKKLDRFSEAFLTYQVLLEKYPTSLYIGDARDRMRFLRDNKVIDLP